jgi:tetratricopeptide (TPR) repeat protein
MVDCIIADNESASNVSARGTSAPAANDLTPPLLSEGIGAQADSEELLKSAAALDAEYFFDEADEVMRNAIASFPLNASIFARYTRMALQRGDLHGAVGRAKQMRERFPAESGGYSDGLEALRELCRIDEANALLKEAAPKFDNEPWPLRNAALIAESQNDMSAAEGFWEALCARFPDSPDSWTQKAVFYRRCGRLEAANELLRVAIERFPSDAGLYIAYGQVAGELRNWEEADRRFENATVQFPNNAVIALQHALVPIGTPLWKSKNFAEALSRLEKVQERFPKFGQAQEAEIRLLRMSGKFDAAATLGSAAMDKLPNFAGIGLEYARVLTLQDKRDAAIACLQDLMQRLPNAAEVYVDLAAALSRAGQWEEAELICKKAIARFRFRRGPLVEYANVAMRRETWREAMNRWGEALRLLPAEADVRKGIATTRLALAAEIEANGGDASEIEAHQIDDRGSISDLLMKFENLGAPVWGCEFGFVQRKFGAEPISLLRWGGVNTDRLIEALECRFEGVGSPEQTILHLPAAGGQMDYHTRDTRFWIELHTFVYHGEMPEDKLLAQCCPRIRYLRRKLIEDLETGSKIFIFRPGAPIPSTEQFARLHAAMRSYGDNTLLHVLCGDPNHRVGTVEIVKPGLMIGYLSRLSWSAKTGVGTPDFSCWIRICAEAYRLHNAVNRGRSSIETTMSATN